LSVPSAIFDWGIKLSYLCVETTSDFRVISSLYVLGGLFRTVSDLTSPLFMTHRSDIRNFHVGCFYCNIRMEIYAVVLFKRDTIIFLNVKRNRKSNRTQPRRLTARKKCVGTQSKGIQGADRHLKMNKKRNRILKRLNRQLKNIDASLNVI